jgi:hypothetical protein
VKTTKKRTVRFLAGVFGMALVLVPALSACGRNISGRYTRKGERISWQDSGFMSFEFDDGIAKIISGGHGGEVTAAPYKVSGKHISIEMPFGSFILEIKDGKTLEGVGSSINGFRFFKSVGDFDFTETNEEGKRGVTITNYAGTNPTVTIPAKINNLPVTAIGEHSFERKQLTGVTIPKGVTTIEYMAFAKNQLTSVIIPDGVTTIGDSVFDQNQLSSVTIPDSVAVIGSAAFANNQLTSIIIPDCVTEITDYTFTGNQLTSIIIGSNVIIRNGHFGNDFAEYYDETNKRPGIYTLVNGRWDYSLHNKEDIKTSGDFEYKENNIGGRRGVTITHYTGINPNLTIPAKINNLPVTAIGKNAFLPYVEEWFDSEAAFIERVGKAPIKAALTSITIPDSVTTIEYCAFEGNHLAGVTIPNSVTTIGDWAFSNNQLTSVTIPDGVTAIGEGVFVVNRLASVTIPDGVTTIGASAFAYNQLSSVTIPGGVTIIGDHAFMANQLTSITIGNNVNIITSNTNPPFDDKFTEYYNSNGKKAGTYTFANGQWSAAYQ